jgi:putative ABC transport system permease protein
MRSLIALASLALRNLRRNRSRTALTLGAIFFGVAMTIVLAGFGNGLGVLITNDFVNGRTGALQVHRAGYGEMRDNEPLKFDMADHSAIEAAIRSTPGVGAVAARLVFGGLVNNGREGTMFLGVGVDPAREYLALPAAASDVAGSPIRRDTPTGAVAGAELARAMKVAPGGTLILQAATQAGQQNALDVDVVGTLENANAFESKRFIQVPLAFAQQLLRMPGKVTEYVVRVDDRDAIDDVAAAVRARLGSGYEVETWRQLRPQVADIIRFQQLVIGIISMVFLVIVIFGVVNTMAMSVLERTREIGTMMALGVRRARISALFLLEAAVLATAGSVLGVGFAQAFVALFTRAGGIHLAPPGSTVERWHLVPVVPAGIPRLAVIGAVLGAVVAALYPAWKAARLRPVEALRAV